MQLGHGGDWSPKRQRAAALQDASRRTGRWKVRQLFGMRESASAFPPAREAGAPLRRRLRSKIESEHSEDFLDFFDPGRGFFFGESGEFASDHDVVPVAGEHQLVVLDLDDGDVFGRGHDFQFRHLEEQLQRRRDGAEAIPQLLLQLLQMRFVGGLGQLAIDIDPLPRIRDKFERDVGVRS